LRISVIRTFQLAKAIRADVLRSCPGPTV